MDLPFHVTPFENESGSISFRVSGSWQGERLRKNFSERGAAEAFCNAKNAAAMKTETGRQPRVTQTFLSDADLAAAESGVERIGNRWQLGRVIAAGIAALEATPDPQRVGPLAEEWLALIESEVSARWWADLKFRVRYFVRANSDLTTDRWDSVFTRTWLDRLDVGKQTKANYRGALHRFGGWLIERGYKKENPAGGIRISGRRSGAQRQDAPMPTHFTPAQAEALLRACQGAVCRRLLGWMSVCLFVGLRPESEAPRATWAEVNFRTGEFSVMGRKRGAKPRTVKLTPTALAWLKVVKADGMDQPAFYLRHLRRKAVEIANGWLAESHPKEKPIVWDEDITRHTYASHRSPQIPVHKLAEEMGTSAAMIYAHYRHPLLAGAVKAFWALRP